MKEIKQNRKKTWKNQHEEAVFWKKLGRINTEKQYFGRNLEESTRRNSILEKLGRNSILEEQQRSLRSGIELILYFIFFVHEMEDQKQQIFQILVEIRRRLIEEGGLTLPFEFPIIEENVPVILFGHSVFFLLIDSKG